MFLINLDLGLIRFRFHVNTSHVMLYTSYITSEDRRCSDCPSSDTENDQGSGVCQPDLPIKKFLNGLSHNDLCSH